MRTSFVACAALFLVAAFTLSHAADRPRRIISLAPNLTEILFAIGAGEQIAGVTDFCDSPAAAQRLPKVGGYVNPNPEIVLALAPDLVLATPNVGNRQFVERLMRLDVPVEIVQARTLEEIFPAIEQIGKAAGRAVESARLAGELREGIEAEHARVAGLPRTKVLLAIQIEPLIAAGHGSYPHDLLALAGAESVVPEGVGAYPRLGLEAVVLSAPDVILQTVMDTRGGPGDGSGDPAADADDASGTARMRGHWSRWPSIPAVESGRIHIVPGDALLRPGPRVLEGLRMLIDLLHPGAPPAGSSVPGPAGREPRDRSGNASEDETGRAATEGEAGP